MSGSGYNLPLSLTKKLDQYNHKNVYLCESIKNRVMNEGNFIRILYSTEFFGHFPTDQKSHVNYRSECCG